ncbi:hypothetical protein [Ktedonobacter robiniae]|uniref:hypothetical protein n=1 Tax=Ktedonobacter robiniae TaxID=2778365 RepID=UPI00191587C4|nr:hypothetical protein [Ktedonobacter robiniae]
MARPVSPQEQDVVGNPYPARLSSPQMPRQPAGVAAQPVSPQKQGVAENLRRTSPSPPIHRRQVGVVGNP